MNIIRIGIYCTRIDSYSCQLYGLATSYQWYSSEYLQMESGSVVFYTLNEYVYEFQELDNGQY